MASYGGAWPSIWPFRMQWLLLQFCFWNIMQVSPWPPLPQNHTVLARMWRSRNSQTLLVGMQNGTATLEDSLVVSYKTKHTLTIWSSCHAPWNLLQRVKNTSTHKLSLWSCRCSFIHCQKQLKYPFSVWINKVQYIYTMDYQYLKKNTKP